MRSARCCVRSQGNGQQFRDRRGRRWIGPQTREVINSWVSRIGVPLKHVWQEDRGFRLAEIRNRAIAASAGGYLIFLDGDCIARPDFIAAHRRLAEPGYFVGGNRVLLSKVLTEAILAEDLEPEVWPFASWAVLRARGQVNRLMPLVTLPLGPSRKRLASEWEGVRGGNFAFFRADLDKVDGFETSFVGWGLEDSDIVIRMIRAGVKRKDGASRPERYISGTRTPTARSLMPIRKNLTSYSKMIACARLRGLSAPEDDRAVAVGQ